MEDNKDKKLASAILPLVGGKDNIVQCQHCMTRLRLVLKDSSNLDLEAVKQVEGVKGCQVVGEQLQIIIGTNVGKVYDEFIVMADVKEEDAIDENLDTENKGEKKSVIDKIFGYLSGTMSPIIPAFIAAGMIQTINAVIGPNLLGIISEESNLYILLSFVGNTTFYFMPMFIAVSAARYLKSSWVIALFLACMMMHPDFTALADSSFTVFGIPCSVQDYAQTVLPILMIVWVASYVEKFFKKHVPDILQVILVPTATILVMCPIALCVLGPIGGFLGTYICEAIIALYDIIGPIATMLLGAFFLLIVFSGMHTTFYVYLFTAFPMLGYDSFFLPGVLASSWSSVGVLIAYLILQKDNKKRTEAVAAELTWAIGAVGEPFMYGYMLPNKKLLLGSIIGGALGGLTAGITGLTAHVLVASNGVYGLLAFVGGSAWNYAALALTIIVSVVGSCVACLILTARDGKVE